MICRDYYFAAWAIEQGILYKIDGKNVILECDASCIYRLKLDYRKTAKPTFDRVKKLIRLIHDANR
jgi:hypothetical protein